jgi:drug/metabolite transporter (DMT)-like permease
LAEPGSIAPTQWWMVALHGGVFIVLSMVLLSIGPRYITSAEVSMLILLESVLAPLLVWAVLGEHPGVWTLAGGTVVVAALLALHLHALLGRGAGPAGRRGG